LFSDELAPEYLGCYGGELATPNLDLLAAQGMRFSNAYSSTSQCTPSRYSLLTGKYAGRCTHPEFLGKFPKNVPYSISWNTHIHSGVPTIASILSENGYVTGMAGKWHVGAHSEAVQMSELSPDDDPANPTVDAKLKAHQKLVQQQIKMDAGFDYAGSVSWGNFDGIRVRALQYHNFPWITKGAVDFLEDRAEDSQPFFLYVATTAVHGPHHGESLQKDIRYTPGGRLETLSQYDVPEDVKTSAAAMPSHKSHLYAGMTSLDHHVGIVLDRLDTLGLADNTMVIFMADHNIEPGKATCFDKGNRVPMIIKWPEKIAAGRVSQTLVQNVDIVPTVLDAAAIATPNTTLDGESLLPVFREEAGVQRDFIYLESGYTRAVTDGRYKYIAFRYPKAVLDSIKSGKLDHAPNQLNWPKQSHSQIAIEHYPFYFAADQLYDLIEDPYEQTNLADHPAYRNTLDHLQESLVSYLKTFEHPYNMSVDPFLATDRFKAMIEKTRSIGTDHIEWLNRDHGKIIWPPAN
jgi:arylsulfatase A-like enzyme